jgi:sugar phosphate permease
MDLKEDTGISTDQFSQLALVFYVTYLAFEFPTGYLMQRLPTAKYLGVNVILWGLMTALVSTAKNWAGLVTLRVLLGCFEAVVAPALVSQVRQHPSRPILRCRRAHSNILARQNASSCS